jgi:hypothetical protein
MNSLWPFFRPALCVGIGVLFVSGAAAQTSQFDPEAPWVEKPQTPPVSFDLASLIPVENPARSSLSFGVIPETVAVGEDAVIRYVMVATSPSGAMNVQYEGIRCADKTIKIYANWRAGDGWRDRKKSEWVEWRLSPARHALQMGRDAFCNVQIVYGPPNVLVKRLEAAAPLR